MMPAPSEANWTYDGFRAAAPAVVQALASLGRAVDGTGLDKGLTELVKVRVSQINGCVFCLKLHLDASRRAGMDDAKLDLVVTWRDAGENEGSGEIGVDPTRTGEAIRAVWLFSGSNRGSKPLRTPDLP
jgi:AhpD family alkylhydroperoxidase